MTTASNLINAMMEGEASRTFLLRVARNSRTAQFKRLLSALTVSGWTLRQCGQPTELVKEYLDRIYSLYVGYCSDNANCVVATAHGYKEFVLPDQFGEDHADWQEFTLKPNAFYTRPGQSAQDFAAKLDDEICSQTGPSEPEITERDYDDEND
jgi:hypothetical protein